MTLEKPPDVFPWRKGFQPAEGICTACGIKGWIVFTGERDQYANHVYHCSVCNADMAAPTFYAWCDSWQENIEKDHFYNPCIRPTGQCPRYMPMEDGRLRCRHFKPETRSSAENKFSRVLDETIKEFDRPKTLEPAQVGAGGLGREHYERLKKERLRKLEEEK